MHKHTKVGLKNRSPPVQNIPTFSVLGVMGPAASEDEEDKEIGYEPMIDDLQSIPVDPKWLLPEMVRP
jgi:hypothetical protein